MIVEAVDAFLRCNDIVPQDVVVACSGGADSTALLLVFADLGGPAVCGHVNHHLRGAESDDDEQFVREVCEKLGVSLEVADGTLPAETIGAMGIEAAARKIREECLHRIAASAGAKYIATAHQRNDQAETVLMRLFTGSGLSGLRAIHPVRDDGFIRPLLDVSRAEIEDFLARRGIIPRFDSSNDDPRFLRNRIRAVLREFGDAALDNLAAIAAQAQSAWPLIDRGLDDVERACAKVRKEETRFLRWPEDLWTRQALLHRAIRRLGDARDVSSADLQRLAASVDSIRRVSVTKELELVRRREALVLRRRPDATPDFELVAQPGVPLFIAETGTTLLIRRTEWRDPQSRDRARQLIEVPDDSQHFVVRNRRRGDRFRPLGLAHDKKLKDFLIDRKIPPELRDRIPLLTWAGEIVWVAGVEVSERFKVTSPAGVLYEVFVEDESQRHQADLQR